MFKFNCNFVLFFCATAALFQETALVAAQSCGATRERWAWTDHSCDEQNEFIDAVYALKENGTYDEFVRVHRAMNGVSHGVAEFLPWHRWFIYKFEEALREVSVNPCITLPYWDWEDTTVFDEDTFDWFDGRHEDSNQCKFETIQGNCLRREMNRDISMWRTGQILGMIMNYDQYGDQFSRNARMNNGFRAAMEGGPHAAPHSFIGGPMLDMLSPSDPLFFVHHANVDRIWALWQDYNDHDQIETSDYDSPGQYEGNLLDRPMGFSQNRMFRMNRGNYPTPRDVLSNNEIVNVLYMNDQFARRLRYNANSDWFDPAPQGSVEVWCDRASFRRERKNRELQMGKRFDDQDAGSTMGRATGKFREEERNEVKISHAFSTSSLRGSNSDVNRSKTVDEQNDRRPALSKYSVFGSVEDCLETNEFIDEDERMIWDNLCQNIPLSTTLADRMGSLAQEECKERNNPFSANLDYIHATHMENELVTFECFHLPDRIMN